MDNCIIAGAGPLYFREFKLPPSALVIAADGGYEHLRRMNIKADVVIGDFDSLRERPDCGIITLPREKNDTDMLAAIMYGISQGCGTFHIYGGAGGRFDHTLANLQCLAYMARQGKRGFLYAEDHIVTAVHNGEMEFEGGLRGTVSVFAHSDIAVGVCLEGLKYELRGAKLDSGYPLGVSNEFTGAPSKISVENGTLIIIFPYGG